MQAGLVDRRLTLGDLFTAEGEGAALLLQSTRDLSMTKFLELARLESARRSLTQAAPLAPGLTTLDWEATLRPVELHVRGRTPDGKDGICWRTTCRNDSSV